MKLELLRKQMEEKEKELQKINMELRDIKYKYEQAIEIPQKKKLIGNFYKYRNSYNCPAKPSDYFWVYIHIIGLKGITLVGNTFQTDKYGKCDFETERGVDGIIERTIKISKSEYKKAYKAFAAKLVHLSV